MSRSQTIRDLSRQLQAHHRCGKQEAVPTGIPALDEILPDRGLNRGSVVELLQESNGCGAGTLAFLVSRRFLTTGVLVVVDRRHEFYPPAVGAWGIDLDRMIVIRPGDDRDALWAIEQSLRCPGVDVTLFWAGHLHGNTFRRLQLAAESGGGLGVLIRPIQMCSQPSWAEIRLSVQPLPSPIESHGRRLHVELLHCRGGLGDGAIELELCYEATGAVRVVSELADSTSARRAARA